MTGWRTEMMKVIAVDVDDCIFDLVPFWIKIYNKDYGDSLEVSSITDWDIKKFVKKDCGKKIYDYVKSSDIYNGIKPVKDSLWGVNTLKELGYRIIYATVNNIENAKYDLLLKYGYMDSGKDFVMAEDKSLIKAEALLDDYYNNISKFPGKGYLMTRSWNKGINYDNRVKGWKDFVKKLTRDIPL